MPVREDGSCGHLLDDGTCGVYEERPNICRSEMVKSLMFPGMPEDEFHKMLATWCNVLIVQEGLDSKYLVQIGQ